MTYLIPLVLFALGVVLGALIRGSTFKIDICFTRITPNR